MLNIKIICVGKIREKATKDLLAEYEKRISKYAKLETIELDDEKIPTNASKRTRMFTRFTRKRIHIRGIC